MTRLSNECMGSRGNYIGYGGAHERGKFGGLNFLGEVRKEEEKPQKKRSKKGSSSKDKKWTLELIEKFKNEKIT